MTIGEKLEEARKRKGVSIREAAEATKIRGDFLLSLEANSFEIPLPEIYVRGFLKNYARFLKIDADRVMTDYDAIRLGQLPSLQKAAHLRDRETAKREYLGRMHLPEAHEPHESAARTEKPMGQPEESEEADMPRRAFPPEADLKSLYVKLGLLVAGALILLVLLGVLISQIRSGDEEEVQSPASSSFDTAEWSPSDNASTEEGTLRLTATGTVSVMLQQEDGNARLFSGTMEAGETQEFETDGPIILRFTNGEFLEVERNGVRSRIGKSGYGALRIP